MIKHVVTDSDSCTNFAYLMQEKPLFNNVLSKKILPHELKSITSLLRPLANLLKAKMTKTMP